MTPTRDHEDQRTSGVCVACQKYTEDGIVRWLPRMSAPDVRLVICADPETCSASQFTQPARVRHFVQPSRPSRYL